MGKRNPFPHSQAGPQEAPEGKWDGLKLWTLLQRSLEGGSWRRILLSGARGLESLFLHPVGERTELQQVLETFFPSLEGSVDVKEQGI